MPNNISSLIRDGIKHSAAGDKNKLNIALKLFQQAYDIDNNNIEVMYYLSAIHRYLGNKEKSIEWADMILAQDPDCIPGIYAKIQFLDKQTLQEEYKKLILTPVPQSTDYHYLTLQAFGRAYKTVGDQEKAIEYYLNALKLNPQSLLSYYNIGLIYQDQGEYLKSLKALNILVQYWDTDFEVLSDIGYNHYMLDHYGEAIKYFLNAEKMAEANSKTFGYYAELADSYYNTDQEQAAVDCYNKGLKKDEYNLDLISRYASRLLNDWDDKSSALFVARKLLNICKDYPQKVQEKYSDERIAQIKKEMNGIKAYIKDQHIITTEKHDDLIDRAHLEEKVKILEYKNEILSNPKLKAYFEAFQKHAGNIYNGCSGAQSGKLLKDNDLAFTKVIGSIADKLPAFAASILKVTCEVINGVNGIRQDNQAKNFLNNTSYHKHFMESLEEAAIEITLQKKAIIMTVSDERSKLVKAFSNIKKKAIVEMYDTPEKKLALIDAAKLVSILILKAVTSAQEIDLTEQFVDAVMNYDNIKANIQLNIVGKVFSLPGKEVLPQVDHDWVSNGKKLVHENGDNFASDNNHLASYHDWTDVNVSGAHHEHH